MTGKRGSLPLTTRGCHAAEGSYGRFRKSSPSRMGSVLAGKLALRAKLTEPLAVHGLREPSSKPEKHGGIKFTRFARPPTSSAPVDGSDRQAQSAPTELADVPSLPGPHRSSDQPLRTGQGWLGGRAPPRCGQNGPSPPVVPKSGSPFPTSEGPPLLRSERVPRETDGNGPRVDASPDAPIPKKPSRPGEPGPGPGGRDRQC